MLPRPGPLAAVLAVLAVAPPSIADEAPAGHRPTAWSRPAFAKHRRAALELGAAYRGFLGAHKTEREVVAAARAMARKAGFVDLLADPRPKVAPGSKLFAISHGKLAALIVVGREPISAGVHVVATHVDAVRLDLKQAPLYADGNLALLETHYYGGIKPYQWLSRPLELRGVVVDRAGKTIEVAIGDDPSEPVLVIADEAAHVSGLVDDREGEEVPGEALDPIVGSIPASGAKGDPFAAEVARLLRVEHGVDVADLASAELELVPAGEARDVGVDRSMVGGYGQDDRACTYAALRAILEVGTPRHTAIVVLADKEEVGSTGNTGAKSAFFRRVVAELAEARGEPAGVAALDRALGASIVFSADVTGALNPKYLPAYQPRTASFLGSGVVWNQNAVHAELMAYVRGLLDGAGVTHQPSTWRKSAASKTEGGTVLPFFTELGMSGLTVGIPLLSMHAPFEVISKADLYEAYRAYRAFLAD